MSVLGTQQPKRGGDTKSPTLLPDVFSFFVWCRVSHEISPWRCSRLVGRTPVTSWSEGLALGPISRCTGATVPRHDDPRTSTGYRGTATLGTGREPGQQTETPLGFRNTDSSHQPSPHRTPRQCSSTYTIHPAFQHGRLWSLVISSTSSVRSQHCSLVPNVVIMALANFRSLILSVP